MSDLHFTHDGKEYIGWARADAEAAGIPSAVLDAAELSRSRANMSCSARQARLALAAAGLLDDVVAWVATSDQAAQIEWEYATRIKRNSGVVTDAAAALGLTEADIDNLFAAANAL